MIKFDVLFVFDAFRVISHLEIFNCAQLSYHSIESKKKTTTTEQNYQIKSKSMSEKHLSTDLLTRSDKHRVWLADISGVIVP